MNDFTELKRVFRSRIDQFSTGKSFLSHDTFDSYESAWDYAKAESKKFGPCAFCVIECDEPQITFNLNLDGDNNV